MTGIDYRSYYDRYGRQSDALIRARRPYLARNIVVGLGLTALTAGIYFYTLRAIGQDDFDDVKVPDAPITAAQAAAQLSKKQK